VSIGADVRDLWNDIETARKLLIFCGAGVTAGRTGISWGDLVTEVARETLSPHSDNEAFGRACTDFFASETYSTEQKATVAAAGVKQEKVVEAVAETLYKNSGYKEGRLLDVLAEFVVVLSARSIEVQIVTTNYDTHIEDSIREKIKQAREGAKILRSHPRASSYPRISYSVNSSDCEFEAYGHKAQQSADNVIKIRYLHGRIDKEGECHGNVVFSERDYAESHNHTTSTLIKLFEDKPTIIVGSSLSDIPLVRSLSCVGSKEPEGSPGPRRRYATMRRMSSAGEAADELQCIRARELDLEPLFFDHYDEITDVFSNLLAFVTTKSVDREGDLPCDLARSDWMEKVGRSFDRHISADIYEYLARLARDIIDDFVKSSDEYSKSDSELIKIEVWCLERDDDVPDGKLLRVWGNSVGPIYTRGLRRAEPVTPANVKHVASLGSFSSGGPDLTPLDKLNQGNGRKGGESDVDPMTSSRWQTFFSVPISRWFDDRGVAVTVAVVTLASMYFLPKQKDADFWGAELRGRTSRSEEPDGVFYSSSQSNLQGGVSWRESFLSIQNDEYKTTLRNTLLSFGQYVTEMIFLNVERSNSSKARAPIRSFWGLLSRWFRRAQTGLTPMSVTMGLKSVRHQGREQ